MNFLLKIVEGPNKGAEITLVEGVAVTLGKGDACDIVLADSTLPEEPLSLEASENGVNVGGEPLDQLHVKTVGSTSFAIGPADSAWGDLVWPKTETKESEAASEPNEKAKVEAARPGIARRMEQQARREAYVDFVKGLRETATIERAENAATKLLEAARGEGRPPAGPGPATK